uniref:Putative U3 small nucleolar RNA-associated protein 7 n=1 Tax=Anthurium amnicola TaxID=1678845 RepID=A0A1D1YRM5_9ARAE
MGQAYRVNLKNLSGELQMNVQKYMRGHGVDLENLKDKKLKGQLSVKEQLYGQSAKVAAKAEKWIMPSVGGYLEAEGLEKTWRIKQESIINEVDILSSRKAYDIVKEAALGPYMLAYTLSGRKVLIAGRKGELTILDILTMDLIREFSVRETVRDVVFLQDEQTYAVAQKKYVYIYNEFGIENHCLKEHEAALKLQYLDKHFLLASVNKFGQLRYEDISTGEMVANYRTGFGRTDVMKTNTYNTVVGLGHLGGKVTMWKPTNVKPLVTMLCHHGPVTAVAFHGDGHLMATAGMDHKIKLWDLRKFQAIRSYAGHAKTLDFSQKGLLAVGNGSYVQIWQDSLGNQNYGPYMNHSLVKGYQVGKVCFRPYEDVLGIGHSGGISSMLVPGSGEPNFDTWVANPYQTTRQRGEKEVHALIDKLQPETIMLDPRKIGTVRPPRMKEWPTKQEIEAEKEAAITVAKNITLKNKTKGRNKPSKMLKKKQEEIDRAKRTFIEQQMKERPMKRQMDEHDFPRSLQRFVRKKSS